MGCVTRRENWTGGVRKRKRPSLEDLLDHQVRAVFWE